MIKKVTGHFRNLFGVTIVIILLTFVGTATIIDFKERYKDYIGNTYTFTADNLAKHPLYQVVDNGNSYTIIRFGETVTIPKRAWIDYDFYCNRIVPIITINNYAQIDQLVTKVNATAWYLTVPWSASQVKSVSDDLIDMGVFRRDIRFTVTDSNTSCNEDCQEYRLLPKVVGGDIRIYFNPQTYSSVVYPLIITEQTITVNNATTSGWTTANISTDGYWSAFSSGSVGTPLNDTIDANLSGYWDFEETAGAILHGINKYGRQPNSSIQGTWNGNTSLNYTVGKDWGNAGLFDGVNDYVSVASDESLNITNNLTVSMILKTSDTKAIQFPIGHGDTSATGWQVYINNGNYLQFTVRTGPSSKSALRSYSTGNWASFNGLYNDSNRVVVFVNNVASDPSGVLEGSISYTGVPNTWIGQIQGSGGTSVRYFNGSLKDVIIDSSGNPIYSNSTYAPDWNISILNQTASAGKVINAVRCNISNLNVQNNTANISTRENGTSEWTQISTNYVTDIWINQTYWDSTDFLISVSGNGSSRAFFVSLEYDESTISPTPTPTTDVSQGLENITVFMGNNTSGIMGWSVNILSISLTPPIIYFIVIALFIPLIHLIGMLLFRRR